MLAGVLAVYVPAQLFTRDCGLVGLDYYQLHLHRLRYAHEAGLSGWYTRELLGAPFWSNLQSFPWVPTRLAVLALARPLYAFGPAVALAASLAALFTYLFARAAGMGRAGAAVAGWTFACAGFFASRVMAGHLSLLEVYPALPLLMWLVERSRGPGSLVALGLAAGAAFLGGHPQLPIYALVTASAYAIWRHGRACGSRLLAMAAGIGAGGFALWPMVLLIGRSTRALKVDNPANSVAFPLSRLAAFVFPWADGWPGTVPRFPEAPFRGDDGVFWDTVCYVGWLPLLAVALLIGACALRRRWPRRPWLFAGAAGALALATALPLVQRLTASIPVTLLRSPARQLYVTTFALALASGVAADRIGRRSRLALALLVLVHALDAGSHARWFVETRPLASDFYGRIDPGLARMVGDGRIAVDYNLLVPENRSFDDAGFFDSLPLAAPYRAVMRLAGSPPGRNEEAFSAGAELPADALARLGVVCVFTSAKRRDLGTIASNGAWGIFSVPLPDARASHPSARVEYRRPDPDHIEVDCDAARAGPLRLIEAYDPGWLAELDGAPVPVNAADGFLLSVDVPQGRHRVSLRFRTPGWRLGMLISAVSALCLLIVARRGGRP